MTSELSSFISAHTMGSSDRKKKEKKKDFQVRASENSPPLAPSLQTDPATAESEAQGWEGQG